MKVPFFKLINPLLNPLLCGFFFVFFFVSTSCKNGKELPQKPPEYQVLEFAGSEEGWPPRPRDISDVVEVQWKEIPDLISIEQLNEYQVLALKNDEVISSLGERYQFIGGDLIEKKAAKNLMIELLFYSYSNNIAVQVNFSNKVFQTLKKLEQYQPIETQNEIEHAINLASNHPELEGKVEEMLSTGIIAEVRKNKSGYGNRLIYLTFTKGDKDVPDYTALVDMTKDVVLDIQVIK